MASMGVIFYCGKNYFLMRIIGVLFTVTLSDSLISFLISFMLEIIIGVRVDLVFFFSSGRLNLMIVSLIFTRWFFLVIRLKFSFFSLTVSISKWTNSLTSLLDSIENAWLVLKILLMVSFIGAIILLFVGLIVILLLTIFFVKTIFGTFSILTISLESGVMILIVSVFFLSSEIRDFSLSNKFMIFF